MSTGRDGGKTGDAATYAATGVDVVGLEPGLGSLVQRLAVMNAQWIGRWDVAPKGHPNDGMVEAKKGLSETEQVVTQGIEKLKEDEVAIKISR